MSRIIQKLIKPTTGRLAKDILTPPQSNSQFLKDVTPDQTLADVTLWIDPSLQTIDSTTTVFISSQNNGTGHYWEVTQSGIGYIYEGDARRAEYFGVNADDTNMVKASFSGTDYYNFNSSALYADWDYTGSFELDAVRILFGASGSNGILEFVRIRDTVETVLGEYDTDNGSGWTNYAEIELSGTIVSGDTLRVRRKSTSSNNARLRAVIGYSTSEGPAADETFITVNQSVIANQLSSKEFAYEIAPTGQTLGFAGNIAHQNDTVEKNRVITISVDGVTYSPVGGATIGTVEINRNADFDYFDTDVSYFASYDMDTSWTVSGINCSHTITFNASSIYDTLYECMWPGPHLVFDEAYGGNDTLVDITADDSSTTSMGSGTQAKMRSTNKGKFVCCVTATSNAVSVQQNTNNTGNKLYFNSNTSGQQSASATDTLSGEFDYVLGLS